MSSSIKFHLPVLSAPDFGVFRAPGPGLGNLLFPIGRAVVGSKVLGGRVVFPTMRQVKVGTYLRRERDKRTYGDIFRPRTRSEWLEWMVASNSKSQDESDQVVSKSIIRYHGLGNKFHDLVGFSDSVKNFLVMSSKQAHRTYDYDIAMHIRLGDFQSTDLNDAKLNSRLTFEWYLEALEAARKHLGTKRPRGVLFTDEDPELLINDLGLTNFVPEPRGNALTKLLAMSQARLLVASRSTFSLWGQYLGNSPAIWPKGFDLGSHKPLDPTYDIFV